MDKLSQDIKGPSQEHVAGKRGEEWDCNEGRLGHFGGWDLPEEKLRKRVFRGDKARKE